LLPDGAEEIPVPNNFVITAPPYNPQRMMSTTEKLDASKFGAFLKRLGQTD
jgi:hypothetical protein